MPHPDPSDFACNIGQMTLRLDLISSTPTSCNSQDPINYPESPSFLWVVFISFWDTGKQFGEAVWVEMTTELEGMLRGPTTIQHRLMEHLPHCGNCARHTERWAPAGEPFQQASF